MKHAHAHKIVTVNYRNLTFFQLSKLDPSETGTIQRTFISEAEKRFGWLSSVIYKAIVEKDILALGRQVIELQQYTVEEAIKRIKERQFDFPRSAQKVDAFMDWLDEMEQSSVLEVIRRPIGIRGTGEEAWTDTFIRSSYAKGIARGKKELKKANYNIPRLATNPDDEVRLSFNQPFHADRVGLIYTRTYNDLKGVTKAMDTQISRELAQGLAEGRGPLDIARAIVDRVDKIGTTRAKTIARTEVMRAHHSANVAEYKRAGVLGIKVVAEWETAADPCPICESLSDGKPFYDIDEIEGLIPAHPNCRCVAVPVPADYADKVVPDTVEEVHGFLPDCHDVLPLGLVTGKARECLTPKDKERVKRAKDSYEPMTKKKQSKAKQNEKKLANSLSNSKHIGDRGIWWPKFVYDCMAGWLDIGQCIYLLYLALAVD